jgi:hypothetical protein
MIKYTSKKNDSLIESFSDKFNILDASICSISVHSNNTDPVIDINLKLSYPQNTYMKLSFFGIKEYCFYWNEKFTFYNIEYYKLLKTDDNMFYISFDPNNEESGISKDDQDFILSENIEGFISTNADF